MEKAGSILAGGIVLYRGARPVRHYSAGEIPLSRQAIIKKTVLLFKEPFPNHRQIAAASRAMLEELENGLRLQGSPTRIEDLPGGIGQYLDLDMQGMTIELCSLPAATSSQDECGKP